MANPRKALLFAAILAVLVGGTAALSTYKVAVANAYLRLRPLPAWAEPRPGADVDRGDRDRGAHLAQIMGCADCHGSDMAGRSLANDPCYLVLSAPNLTPEPITGHLQGWTAARWHQALRLGMDGEWRMLWCMPRAALLALADADVAALGAYLRQLPPVARELPTNRVGWRGYIDVAFRQLRLLDRTVPAPAAWRPLPPGPNEATLGAYLWQVGSCQTCHTDSTGSAPSTWRPRAASGGLVGPTAAQLVARLGNEEGWHAAVSGGRCPTAAPEASALAAEIAPPTQRATATTTATAQAQAPCSSTNRLAPLDYAERRALWHHVRALTVP